ncbi:hypothetical protein T484DRAFT_1830863 [Baffinella frigidus]|nr:hypothetical protein T484DRAFT_1830863 [Cryptophyta sp. CCMP2293]
MVAEKGVPLLAAVAEAYKTLQRPIVIHCRTGHRAIEILVEAKAINMTEVFG